MQMGSRHSKRADPSSSSAFSASGNFSASTPTPEILNRMKSPYRSWRFNTGPPINLSAAVSNVPCLLKRNIGCRSQSCERDEIFSSNFVSRATRVLVLFGLRIPVSTTKSGAGGGMFLACSNSSGNGKCNASVCPLMAPMELSDREPVPGSGTKWTKT